MHSLLSWKPGEIHEPAVLSQHWLKVLFLLLRPPPPFSSSPPFLSPSLSFSVGVCAHMWRSEDTVELVLSLHLYRAFEDWASYSGLQSKCPYLQRHLAGPRCFLRSSDCNSLRGVCVSGCSGITHYSLIGSETGTSGGSSPPTPGTINLARTRAGRPWALLGGGGVSHCCDFC